MAGKKRTTRLLFWNANGAIRVKTPELLHLVKLESIDIVLVNETHLIPSDRWQVPGFSIVRSDRTRATANTRGGGTAILVGNSSTYTPELLPQLRSLEATSILLQTSNGLLRCVAAYCPPGATYYTSDIDHILKDGTTSVLAGDLNAKHISWNSTKNCPRGLALLDHATESGFTIAGPVDPTYHHFNPQTPPDVLDIALLHNFNKSYDITTIQALTSDHDPVLLLLGNTLLHTAPRSVLHYARADWQRYRAHIHARLEHPFPDLSTPANIDEGVSILTSTIRRAAEVAIPRTTLRPPDFLSLPPGLARSVAIKNRARRHWQAFRTVNLRIEYNRLAAQLRRDITSHRKRVWEQKLSTLSINDHSIWPMAKSLLKRGTPNPPLTTPSGPALSSAAKAEAIATVLEKSFTPNPPANDSPELDSKMEKFFSISKGPIPPDELLCSPKELVSLLKALNPKKSPGPDSISARLILQLPGTALSRLLQIFTASFRIGHFPTAWKHAKVISILKPGKPPTDPSSYRPISLLNILGKVFERTIQARLKVFIADKHIIPPAQFGFTEGTSTEHQLLRLTNKISHGFNNNSHTAVVFLDVAKAFDKVWHAGLLFKLAKQDCPRYLLHLLHSYLNDRTFVASWMGSVSSPRQIQAGVPQGSVLSPMLFNLYTADLPPLPQGVVVHLFADDNALAATSRFSSLAVAKLQRGLNTVAPYYSKWKLGLNPLKTVAVLFSKRRVSHLPRLTLGGRNISWSKSAPYLGVILDSRFTWRHHIRHIHQRAVRKISSLAPLLHSSSISRTDRLTIYRQVIRPSITYACPIWAGAAQTSIDSLQPLQNRVLRTITHSPKATPIHWLHQDIDFPMLQEHITGISRKFFRALRSHPHTLVRFQCSFHPTHHDRHPRPIASIGTRAAYPRNAKKRIINRTQSDSQIHQPTIPAKKRRV